MQGFQPIINMDKTYKPLETHDDIIEWMTEMNKPVYTKFHPCLQEQNNLHKLVIHLFICCNLIYVKFYIIILTIYGNTINIFQPITIGTKAYIKIDLFKKSFRKKKWKRRNTNLWKLRTM